MAIRIKARPRLMNVGPHAGKKVYKLTPEFYTKVVSKKVCERAAHRNNLSLTIVQAAVDALAESIKDYLVLGHSVELGDLGTLRLSVRAKTAEQLTDVSVDNIYRRRLVFTPSKEIQQYIDAEPLVIECYDEQGKKVRRINAEDLQNEQI